VIDFAGAAIGTGAPAKKGTLNEPNRNHCWIFVAHQHSRPHRSDDVTQVSKTNGTPAGCKIKSAPSRERSSSNGAFPQRRGALVVMSAPKFPVVRIREDGTPAIWFTHTHWLLLRDGIIRAYLENREQFGRCRARREMRRELGEPNNNRRLNEWRFLDSLPQEQTNVEYSMDLFVVGYNAYLRSMSKDEFWTPEKLRSMGDRKEEQAYKAELELIQEEQPKEAAA
jgi:hypothetical protein